MRYHDEYSARPVVDAALAELEAALTPGRAYRFMEFCGGHTHALFQSGLMDRLPAAITMLHGPGCPVCVLPGGPVRAAIDLLERDPGVLVATYADLMRVPAGGESFRSARDRGLDVRPVSGPAEAYAIAERHPDRSVVFLAIGFETTTPPTALIVKRAAREGRRNFFVYAQHLRTGPALDHLLEVARSGRLVLDGFIGPGHVALVTGAGLFRERAARSGLPIAIAGFTPFDLVRALTALVHQVERGRAEVEITYRRAVTEAGNPAAQAAIAEVFEPRPAATWRGLGELPESALRLRPAFADWDAERAFDLRAPPCPDHPRCLCPAILLGERAPLDCALPLGPCMVSSEGACAAVFRAGRHLLAGQAG
jgi:hydrogenase expression/formation protein HypD